MKSKSQTPYALKPKENGSSLTNSKANDTIAGAWKAILKRVTLIIKNAYKSYQHGQFDLLRLHVFDPLCMLAACVIGGACLEAFSPPLKAKYS